MSHPMPTHAGRARRAILTAALAASAAALSGCAWLPGWLGGGPSKPGGEVAPLPEFRPALATRVAWRVDVGAGRGAFLQPAVVENAVYAAAADGTVVRLSPTGQTVWRTETRTRLSAGVGSDGFTVAVGSARGDVIALGADGKELWRTQIVGEVQSPPLVGRGLVVVRGSDQRITAFDAESGKRRWTYQRASTPLTVRTLSELAFAGDNVVAGFPAGRLVALAQSNGAVRWDVLVSEPRGATEVERLADVMGGPLVAAGDVCAASYQGRLACFEAGNGTLRWARDVSAASGPGGDEQRVAVVDARSHVYAYSRTAGASAWQQQKLTNRDLSTPLVLRRAVVAGDFQGVVHFLSPEDGAFVGRVELGSAIVAPPRAFGGGAVVQTQAGVVALIVLE